ncbi:nitrilase-related carbon-nitrogen hydrolase [Knoellia sp. CPCC 206453]|uniref:nitrilase-related carbon-nitrogen hydrolase n=1 Tax=Knoellia pratensis TaxID=3404796 RepID=UPI00360DE41E
MVTVAACQLSADVDAGPDEDALAASVVAAARAGARLVVLPELALGGSCFADVAEARTHAEFEDGRTAQLVQRLSGELGIVVVAGFALLAGESVHNAAVIADRGEVLGVYRKVHLWDAEHQGFVPSDGPPLVVDTHLGRVGVMICYDLEFPEWGRMAVEAGAQLLAVPVNWPLLPRPEGVPAIEVAKAQAVAAAYGVHVVVADRCGTERGVDWVGGSLVCESTGYLLAGPATPPGELARPGIVLAEVDLGAADDKQVSTHNHLMRDRRPDLYSAT